MGTASNPIGHSWGSPNAEKDAPSSSLDNADLKASQIRHDIAQTRANMSETIEELHGKLNPAVLKDQALTQIHEAKEALKIELHDAKETITAELKDAKDTLKAELRAEFAEAKALVREATIGKVEHMVHSAQHTVTDINRSVVDTIRENPIPTALVGIGLGWLLLSARNASSRRQLEMRPRRLTGFGDSQLFNYGKDYEDERRNPAGTAVDRLGEKAGEVAHSIQNLAGDATEKAARLVQKTKTSLGDVTHGAVETVRHLAHDAESSGRRMENQAENLFRENPLAVGAAVLAAGTAIGLAIPITRREDMWMGGMRDEMMSRAGMFAQDALEKVEDAAKQVGNASSKGISENGGMPKMPKTQSAPNVYR